MKKYIITFLALLCVSLTSTLYAGKDPIAWSILPSQGFPSTSHIGSSYAVTYTLSNNLPFAVPLHVSAAYLGGSFALTHGCNTTLTAVGKSGSSCLLHLSLQPVRSGVNTARVTIGYHNNQVPLPLLMSTSTSSETAEKISGFVTTPLPAVTYIGGTSYPVAFSFANNGNSPVTATAVNVSGFTATTNTCTSPVANSSSCTVSGTFVPASTGQVTLSVTYVYSNGSQSISVPLTTQSNVENSSGGCHHISGFAMMPLPASTYVYANHVIQYQFTNNCTASPEALGTVNITSDATSNPPTITKGTDTCSNQTLAASGTCSVFFSVIPNTTAPATNDLSVTASIPYDNSTLVADATTSAIVNAITNQNSLHTVFFVNQCNQNVWYAFQNGGVTGKSPDPTPSPNRTWQGYQLNQQMPGTAPSVTTLQFSQYTGGSIVGRTGCDTNPLSGTYGVCSTGNCTSLGNSTGTCTCTSNSPAPGCTGSAPTNPATIYEETITSTPAADGVYDISLINGFNIPGEFRSIAPIVIPLNFQNACGQSSGAIIQQDHSGLPICPWSFTPPNTGTDCTAGTQTDNPSNYYFVTAGSDTACTPGSCSGTDVCGMAWTPQPSINPQYLGSPVTRRCGTFQGYWTVADWVNYADSSVWGSCNLYSHYSLGTQLDSIKPSTQPTYGFFPTTSSDPALLASLYACQITSNDSLDSGYDANKTNACGCHDWNDPNNFVAPQITNCLSFNPLWTSYVFGRISWLKTACPTAYSYQFDDTSSQFTCNVAGQQTAYQITFCPGGKTGAPGT